MLALRGTLFQLGLHRNVLPLYPHACCRPQRRRLMQGLCEGFLDLAVALPIPPAFPPYSTTIILVTLVTRATLLPIAVWGRQRVRKVEEVVLPEVERLKPVVAKQVLEEMRKDGIRGSKEDLQQIHTQRSVALLTAYRKELFVKHRCKPLPSIVLPPLSQLPIFIITTIALGRLSTDPTPFDSESFLTLSNLAHPDPTMTLPILLGLITMANVESSNWVMTAAERERARRIEELNEKRRMEQGGKARVIQPQKIIKSTLRFLSVARIIVAAMTPGSIALYWVTSASLGLFQTWVMDWLDLRRRRRLESPARQPMALPTTSSASRMPTTPSLDVRQRRRR